MKLIIKLLASGFGLGYIPFAPGTFGTLLGIAIFLPLSQLSPAWYISSAIALILISIPISKEAERIFGKKDSAIIVIDEVAGFIVAMALIKPSLYSITAGFIFFRFFDIVKVWPAKAFDKMEGGFAVVMDDVVAGIYANALLIITMHYLPLG